MSNLTSSVKFDVLRGWPDGSAIADALPVKSGDVVKEGQLVELFNYNSGTLQVKKAATAVPLLGTDSVAPGIQVHLRMVIQGNDQFDGSFTKKAVVLRGAFTVKTEKFIAGSYSPGDLLTWSVAANTEGYLTKATGVAATQTQIVGVVEEYDSVNGTIIAALNLV